MLASMYAALLLFSLSGCSEEYIETEKPAADAEEGTVTTASVTFSLQGEDASRALTAIDFTRFDVKAYIFQANKKNGLIGGWSDKWSDYEFTDFDGQDNPADITSNEFTLSLPVKKDNTLSDEKYQYKVVFLAAPKGSSVLPAPEKSWEVGDLEEEYHDFLYDFDDDDRIASTNLFNWYADKAQGTDNAVYRDVAEVLSNDKEDFDDIAFTTDINEIPVELRHKDGAFRLTVKQTVLSEANRAKATKASLTIGNVPQQMYLKGSTEWKNDEVACTGAQEYTKKFGIDLSTGDAVLEMHSLPQEEGISCTVKLYDEAGNVYCENSFTPEAGVKIRPNMISKVTLDAKGFEFGIQLEDDAWDGPND